MLAPATAAVPESNPVRTHAVQLGPEANRLIVGFRATARNAVTKPIKVRARTQSINVVQARNHGADVAGLAGRAGLAMARSRQITPEHACRSICRRPSTAPMSTPRSSSCAPIRPLQFADVDQRRYPHAAPDDPLFVPTAGASGQWYMHTPSATSITLDGVATMDLSATDAVSAWDITTGSTGTVIADVDTACASIIRILLRAGFGGRLLPGYDFVGQDYNPTTGAALGTFLIANDGDGWDPDPSDPGDWISSTDQQNTVLFPSRELPDRGQLLAWHPRGGSVRRAHQQWYRHRRA